MRTHSITPPALLVALLLAPSAWSQTAPEEQTAAAAAQQAPAADLVIKDEGTEATGTATKGKDASGADTLSVDFPDEDIRNILRNVADLFELNLVVPEALQGRTSIKLRDVSWRQIFQVVLTPVNYTYVVEGNIIKIVSIESLSMEPPTTEVFILNYARAGDIMPTVNTLVDSSKGGKIVKDDRSNAIIITERPSQMNRIRPIIESLDKATDQVMIESKFVEVTQGDIRDLGLDWTVSASAGIGQDYSKNKANSYDKSRNSGNSTDDSASNSRNQSANNNTNNTFNSTRTVNNTQNSGSSSSTSMTPPSGPLTTTYGPTTTSTSNTDNYTSSAVTTVSNAASDVTAAASSLANEVAGSTLNLFNNSATSGLNTAVFSNYEFGVILKALQTSQNTKLVSNPTVVTLNNSEAQINIGKEFPIPKYTYNSERGTYEVSGFDYRPIGIILKVTPQVNARGFIKLMIEPEVSSSNESTSFGTANIPIVTTRKTKTQVSLKDGYTMGIGGLIESNYRNDQTRLPVLGSIPVLGRLFRSDSNSQDVRNLIIFITAKTVNADGAPIEEVFDPRRVRQLQMRRDELPGYRDNSEAFLPPVDTSKAEKKK